MKNSNRRELFINALISSALTALFVTASVSAATTISTNISTEGTLTVSGAVTLGDAGGDAIILTGNASTTNALTVGGVLYVTGNQTVGGLATTTASSGNIDTAGTITAVTRIGVATTSPRADFSIDLDTDDGVAVWNKGSTTPAFIVSGVNSAGRVGLGTTTPVATLSAVTEVATSTLYLHSESETKGGCIQLESAAGTGATFRLIATSTGVAVWESGTCLGVGAN